MSRAAAKLGTKPARRELPLWMRPYLVYICNTGGNDIEDMWNGDADPVINLPLSTLQAAVKSQIILLQRLYDAGLLRMLARPSSPLNLGAT